MNTLTKKYALALVKNYMGVQPRVIPLTFASVKEANSFCTLNSDQGQHKHGYEWVYYGEIIATHENSVDVRFSDGLIETMPLAGK